MFFLVLITLISDLLITYNYNSLLYGVLYWSPIYANNVVLLLRTSKYMYNELLDVL
jgi:hypothetical protein